MKLARINIEGFKGQERDITEVPQVLVLTGPNGSGKSAIREAVELTLRGEITGCRYKKSQDIYQHYATDNQEGMIKTQVFFDTGDAEPLPVSRFIGRDRKTGKVNESITFLGKSIGLRANQASIDKVLNPCLELLDFEAIARMSDRELREYFLGLLAIEGDRRDAKDIVYKTLKDDGDPFKVGDPRHPIACELLDAWPPAADLSFIDGLIALGAKVRSMLSERQKLVRDSATVEETLAEMESAVEKLTGDVVKVDRDIKDAEKRRTQVHGLIETAKAKREELDRWKAAKTQLEKEVVDAKEKRRRFEEGGEADYDGAIAKQKAIIDEAGDAGTLSNEIEENNKTLASINEEIRQLGEEVEAATAKKIEAEKMKQFANERTCPVDDTVHCPLDWDYEAKDEGLWRINVELGQLVKRKEELGTEYEENKNHDRDLMAKAKRLIEVVNTAEARIKEIEQTKKNHEEHRKFVVEGHQEAEKRLKTHNEAEPHAEGIDDTTQLEQEYEGLEKRIGELRDDYDSKIESKGREIAKVEAERRRLNAGVEIEYIKAIKTALEEYEHGVIGRAIVDCDELINKYLPNNWDVAIDLHGNLFGVVIDGTYRSIYSLSGGEEAYFAGILALASMNMKGARVRILLVEAGEMDNANVVLFIKACSLAVAEGNLDNAIICRAADIDYDRGFDIAKVVNLAQ